MNKAFTLIELLVVISILGLLSSLVLVSLQGAKDQADIAKAQEFSHTVRVTMATDLVGEWRFDNNTNDSSGYDNNGTIVGDSGYVDGMFGQALEFDGNDYVDCGNNNNLYMNDKDMTMSLWVNLEGSGTRLIAGQVYCWRWNYGMLVVNEDYYVQLTNNTGGTSDYNTGVSLDNDKWYFLAFTIKKDSNELIPYVNGEKLSIIDITASLPLASITTGGCWQRFAMGRHGSGASYLNGTLDEVQIYNRALLTTEIKQLYAQGAEKHNIVLK